MDMPKIVGRATEFTTPWLSVISKTVAGMPGSAESQTYYGIQPADYVTVLPITPDKRVVVVRQYRPMVEAYTLELPSGHVDAGHTPEEAARQELLEETGYAAGRLESLGMVIPDVGRLANRQWSFLATDLTRVPGVTVEEGIAVSTVSMEELRASILDGTFNHALHLAVVAQAICGGKLALLG
jgi:ADP-ribose pyrophosphatase